MNLKKSRAHALNSYLQIFREWHGIQGQGANQDMISSFLSYPGLPLGAVLIVAGLTKYWLMASFGKI